MRVVCLHGLGRTPADWDGVAPGLGAFGDVAAPAREAAADAVLAGAIVVGHSRGGVDALRGAGRVPVRAVVVTGCFFPPARNGRGLGASVGGYLAHRVAYVRGLQRGRPRAATAGGLAGLARLGLRRAAFDALAARVSAPVLVVHARDDHHVPVDFALAAVARHPGWDVRVLDGGGHHAHVDDPAAWLAVVSPWLAAH